MRRRWESRRSGRLNSVGPSPVGDTPNAQFSLRIRSNVDSAASLSLSAPEPIAAAGQIRARAESLGGYVEIWNESRWDDGEHENVHMELVVRASDLRDIMNFGTTLGDAERWEFESVGQGAADAAPNSRLTVDVYTDDGPETPWVAIVVIVGVIVIAGAAVAALIVWRRRRQSRADGTHMVADLESEST